MKTADLIGAQLDWAVAKCEGRTIRRDPMGFHDKSYWIWEETPSGRGGVLIEKSIYMQIGGKYRPSTNWEQGGPIIEREILSISPVWQNSKLSWEAYQLIVGQDEEYFDGETILIAAMRCYVASKLGDEVEIPEELCLNSK